MTALVNRFGLIWEDSYPEVIAVGCAALSFVFLPQFFGYTTKALWDISALYSSVFNIASVGTGFLFTFYTFVVTTDRGFIGRAKDSRYYKMMVKYTLQALWLGTGLTIVSIPMQMIVPTPTSVDGLLMLTAFWAALVGWALAAFYRAAYIFSIFASQHH